MVGTSGRSPAPWAPPSKALGRHQRRTQRAEALIASMYLAGVNTRRVKRALGSLFWTLLPSGQILMHKLDGWAIVSQPIQPINHQGIQWPVLSFKAKPIDEPRADMKEGFAQCRADNKAPLVLQVVIAVDVVGPAGGRPTHGLGEEQRSAQFRESKW